MAAVFPSNTTTRNQVCNVLRTLPKTDPLGSAGRALLPAASGMNHGRRRRAGGGETHMNRILATASLIAIATLPGFFAHANLSLADEPKVKSAKVGQPTRHAGDPAIQEIDTKLKALRAEFHGQLDPLQAQIKALKDKYDPPIQSLEEQKKTLVEQGKPPAIQQLDQQEAAELDALAGREKDEIDKVKQRYAEEKQRIRQTYDGRRKAAR
jgi:Skp family chaperone for outer membrane proteins